MPNFALSKLCNKEIIAYLGSQDMSIISYIYNPDVFTDTKLTLTGKLFSELSSNLLTQLNTIISRYVLGAKSSSNKRMIHKIKIDHIVLMNIFIKKIILFYHIYLS